MSIGAEMKATLRDPERVHEAQSGWATPEVAIYSDVYFDSGGGLTAGYRELPSGESKPGACRRRC